MLRTPLLPNEPRVQNWAFEDELTQRFLAPALGELESLFLGIRAELDPSLSKLQPTKNNKPYPLGQCLEITLAVQRHLREINSARLFGRAADGFGALTQFKKHGGTVRQVWGDLRGTYFQNSFLVGTLYIDASNDTVVPTKPKVEVLPFEKSQFTPVKDHQHFARIARSYWKAEIYPNHLVPELAPYFPLIVVEPSGRVSLQCASGYMLGLTAASRFRSSEDALSSMGAMPNNLFSELAGYLRSSPLKITSSAEQGLALALSYCKDFRRKNIIYR